MQKNYLKFETLNYWYIRKRRGLFQHKKRKIKKKLKTKIIFNIKD